LGAAPLARRRLIALTKNNGLTNCLGREP